MANNIAAGLAVLVVIALIFSGAGFYFGYTSSQNEGPIGLVGDTGPQGPIGDQGPAGEDGTSGTDGTDGTDGADGSQGDKGDTGDAGPQGPAGETGPQGDQGPQGEPGTDLEPNEAPVVVAITMDDCVTPEDDWIFCLELDDLEDDLMKVEFYFYIDTAWFEGMGCPLELIPYLAGDHIWLPFFNEVGNDGEYCFDGTNIKNMINHWIGGIPDCTQLKWRYDVIDGENFISDEVDFTVRDCCDCPE